MATETGEGLTQTEQKALATGFGEIDYGAIKSLAETEAGEEATPIEEVTDPFLIVSAYTQAVSWDNGDNGSRQGFVTHMLCMLDPQTPKKLTEVYSNSEAIAVKIQTLLEKDDLGPEHPVVVKFETAKTRSGYTVHKLEAPTKQELQTFIAALQKAS